LNLRHPIPGNYMEVREMKNTLMAVALAFVV